MSAWWLLIICPAWFYFGYVYSNWRWQRLIRSVAKPKPNPYRDARSSS